MRLLLCVGWVQNLIKMGKSCIKEDFLRFPKIGVQMFAAARPVPNEVRDCDVNLIQAKQLQCPITMLFSNFFVQLHVPRAHGSAWIPGIHSKSSSLPWILCAQYGFVKAVRVVACERKQNCRNCLNLLLVETNVQQNPEMERSTSLFTSASRFC